ncbi:hypothetical protein EXN66_Car017518 [Channa argus]|uniref:Uncharacterized protein n=1 Tax=Channa argus TaxID=215402 RepID=A0A6G1QGL3_CHAAH|nr:hypothetical protein EXN66_Car017518 [Channa argus]
MNETEEKTAEDQMSDFGVAIKCFLGKMTLEQHGHLLLETPDKATRLRLAKICMELILCLSRDILKAIEDFKGQTENRLFSRVENMFIQTFFEVLDIKDRCVSLEELTTLIIREVKEIINSALHNLNESKKPKKSRITPPNRVSAMVKYVLEILKTFGAKIKTFCTSIPCTRRDGTIITHDLMEKVEVTEVSVSPQETPDTSMKSETSITEISQAVQEAITEELTESIHPLLDELSDSDYISLQSESSQDIRIAADDIAQVFVKETDSLKQYGSASPSPTLQRRYIMCMDRIVSKIKTFFAKMFAKSSVQSILAHLRNDLKKESKAERKDSIRSLVESVESLILPESGGEDEGESQVFVFSRFNNVLSGKIPTITEELTDLFYRHFQQDAPLDGSVYTTIKNRICCYLGLTNWWLNSEVNNFCEKVILALMKTLPLARTPFPKIVLEKIGTSAVSDSAHEEAEQYSEEQTEIRKTHLKVVIEMLVTKTYNNAKVSPEIGNPEDLIHHLLEKIWTDLKGLDFEIRTETMSQLSKAILKDLCEKIECPLMLLVRMRLRDPQIEECLISSLKQHLTHSSEQQSRLSWFFSSIGKI